MSVVPFRPFHACMNSNAVTLLSCGGAAVNIDEDKAVVDALADATDVSSALDDDVVTRSTDAAADSFALAAFSITSYSTNLLDYNTK